MGVGMLITGVFFFWWSMQSLNNNTFLEDTLLWMLALTAGMTLVCIGPSVMLREYASSYQAPYKQIAKQKQWQVIQVPLKCAECGNAISIRSLEWIGEEEVRYPFCSKDLEIKRS